MNDHEAVQWINENAPAEMRWWIHDRLRYLPSKKEFEMCPNCGGSEQTPNACDICDPHGINYQQPDQTMSLTDLKYAKEENAKLKQKVEAVQKALRNFDNARIANQWPHTGQSRAKDADDFIEAVREALNSRHNA
jgi:methionyl-tRNA synthetase